MKKNQDILISIKKELPSEFSEEEKKQASILILQLAEVVLEMKIDEA